MARWKSMSPLPPNPKKRPIIWRSSQLFYSFWFSSLTDNFVGWSLVTCLDSMFFVLFCYYFFFPITQFHLPHNDEFGFILFLIFLLQYFKDGDLGICEQEKKWDGICPSLYPDALNMSKLLWQYFYCSQT